VKWFYGHGFEHAYDLTNAIILGNLQAADKCLLSDAYEPYLNAIG